MNRVAKAGLGCLLLPVGLAVLGVVFMLFMKAAGVPDPEIRESEFAQEIGTPLTGQDVAGSTLERVGGMDELSGQAAASAVVVDLDVEECEFFLESGPAADGVRVEANYDEATYKLTRSYDMDGETPVFRLKFRSKVSILRRLAKKGAITDEDLSSNSITVFLPENTPIALHLRIVRGTGRCLLDDLVLTNLVTNCKMGEYTLDMGTPNPITMKSASLNLGMGEGAIRGLANLRARTINIDGGMGENSIDFGSSLLVDTRLVARMKMGEMVIEVPDNAMYDPDSRARATLGEVANGMQQGQRIEDPESSRRLSLDAVVFMGELRLEPFSAESRPVLTP